MSKYVHKQVRNQANNRVLATVGIYFAIFCWGGAYIAARYLLHPLTAGVIALSPVLLATLRFSIASCFFVAPVIQAIRHRLVSGRDLLMMALLGQLTFSLYYWLQYIGIQKTDASISSVLGVGLIPIFTTLLTPLFGEEQLNKLHLAVLFLGFFGVALIAFQQPLTLPLQSDFLLGVLCLVSNTFFFAIYTHLSKRWMRNISPVVMTGSTMISGAIGLLFLSLLDPLGNNWNNITLLDGTQWTALLFLSLACSVLAYVAYNNALTKMDASRVTTYFYVEPVITIVLGVTLLGEHLTWQSILGTVTIGGSVIIVNHLKKTQKNIKRSI